MAPSLSLWLTLHTLSHSKHVPETQQQTINCCQTCLSMSQSPRNLPPSETNCHSDCLWTRRLVPTYPRYHHSLIFWGHFFTKSSFLFHEMPWHDTYLECGMIFPVHCTVFWPLSGGPGDRVIVGCHPGRQPRHDRDPPPPGAQLAMY